MISTLNPAPLKPFNFTNPSRMIPFSPHFFPNFKPFPQIIHYPYKFYIPKCSISSNFDLNSSKFRPLKKWDFKGLIPNSIKFKPFKKWEFVFINLVKSGIFMGLVLISSSMVRCNNVFAIEKGNLIDGNLGIERLSSRFRSAWRVILKVLGALKEHGVVLGLLLGLSAFFSMAETSITTLWPYTRVS